MREIYSATYLSWSILLLSGAIGCHQEPAIPATGIPETCQVYRIANVNENVQDTTFYRYDTFGHLVESTYNQLTNDQLTATIKQRFTYSADHFLTAQTEQSVNYSANGSQTLDSKNYTYTYTYQDGLLQQVAVTNTPLGQVLGFRLYTYEGGKLKTYTETNAQRTPALSYTYDGAGKLIQFTDSGSASTLTNGKITKRTLSNGQVIDYLFDNQGQLISEISTSATSRTERTYTYDNRPYWNKTQLLLRGIPSPDLGGHTFLHNVATSRLVEVQNTRTIRDQSLTYEYGFNKANYSTGYSRSDGFRQRIIYANCL